MILNIIISVQLCIEDSLTSSYNRKRKDISNHSAINDRCCNYRKLYMETWDNKQIINI